MNCGNHYPGKSLNWLIGNILCWLINTAASAGGFSSSIINFPLPALPYGSDYVEYTYASGVVATATYKKGGAAGAVVKTITYANDGTNITSITAS